MTTREKLFELVSKLFIYTDHQEWDLLMTEVFSERVFLDMTSLGGSATEIDASEICNMWAEGFKDLDAVNHLAGNYLIREISDEGAKVFAYATATHYKESAQNGQTRAFVGTYDLEMKRSNGEWRICGFTYNLKYLTGNIDLN